MKEKILSLLKNIIDLLPLVILSGLFGGFLFLIHKNVLNVQEYINVLGILVWPLTIILLAGHFFQDEIRSLLNRITSGKLPGGVEFNAESQQSIEDPESPLLIKNDSKSLSTINTTGSLEFDLINNFFVLNTKEALKWFSEQTTSIPMATFYENFNLPNTDIEGQIEREKHVIFSTLIQFDMLESVTGNLFKISEKGERFLRHIGLIG
jgi:hypothetical protein